VFTGFDSGCKVQDLMTPLQVPRLTNEQMQDLVRQLLAGTVLTSDQVPPEMLKFVFMVVGLGGFAGMPAEDLEQIGCVYEHLSEAGPTSINGFPVFFSLKIMHINDWKIVRATLVRELKRATQIELEKDEGHEPG
jgi:hypothetical protein